MIKPNVLIL